MRGQLACLTNTLGIGFSTHLGIPQPFEGPGGSWRELPEECCFGERQAGATEAAESAGARRC